MTYHGAYILTDKKTLARGIHSFTVHAPEMAREARPGQFLHCKVEGFFLRRPISICRIGKDTLTFVFEERGEGTRALAERNPGDSLDIMGPLGNGFSLLPLGEIFLIGGGIGTPPMLELAAYYGHRAQVFLGFRNRQSAILADNFYQLGGKVHITTEDGSLGEKGFVTAPLLRELEIKRPVILYACGPTSMLKAVQEIAVARHIPAQLSLEERMACGVGGCLVCVCRTRDEGGQEGFTRVCKDGPVFDAGKVVFPHG